MYFPVQIVTEILCQISYFYKMEEIIALFFEYLDRFIVFVTFLKWIGSLKKTHLGKHYIPSMIS